MVEFLDGEKEETITMLDARQTEIDTRIVRRILRDMDDEWPWPEYPGLDRRDIHRCLKVGRLVPGAGRHRTAAGFILAKAVVDSLETCLPEVEEADWEYIRTVVRAKSGSAYSDDELRAAIERVLASARAARAN